MSSIGWEFYGVKFSMFMTMLTSLIVFASVWLGAKKGDRFSHIDTMAGDEGED